MHEVIITEQGDMYDSEGLRVTSFGVHTYRVACANCDWIVDAETTEMAEALKQAHEAAQ